MRPGESLDTTDTALGGSNEKTLQGKKKSADVATLALKELVNIKR